MFVMPVSFGTPEFDELLALRDVILRKPLGLEFTVEQIATEYDSIHLACYTSDWHLLGCLTLLPLDEKEVKMRQVVVAVAAQKKGVGRMLVEAGEEWARRKGFSKMVLHAREVAVPFYLKLDYRKVGERFKEVDLPHFKMEKDM
ncbi:MAG: GNAT family N-acetyltransferase [Saprospirales bacterium]|nr:GNAT family N-acetyltransferase [Saprospirales bacterium]MBK8492285.1 GNAT family N-acetyltransferase [Saprospirales bacterium]